MRSLWPEEKELRGRDGQAWVEAFSVVPSDVRPQAMRVAWWDFVSLHTRPEALARGFDAFDAAVKDRSDDATNYEIASALVAVGYSLARAVKRVKGGEEI